MRKFLSVLLAMAMVLSLTVTSFAADTAADAKAEMAGKTVILHTNDVHGAVEGYAYIAQLKADYEAKGAEVILVDAGDYSQGKTYVSVTKGADAVTMMNAAGYDVVTLGNHEFDYGYAQLKENMSKAKFKVVCADVFNEDGTPIFDASYTYTTKSGVKVGFFGMETPETQTKANPALIKGLTFADKDAFTKAAADQVAALKDADVVICLAHLGVDVRLNTRADKALLDSLKPQTVFVAEGSTPRTLALPGADGDNVVSALDVLEGKAKAGKSVVIIGAGLVACELALHLVQNGHTVTLLARRKLLRSAKLPAMNELMLRDLLVFHGVHIVEGAALESVDAKGVYYEVEGVPALAEGDTVITAVGMEANHALFDAIRDDYETVLALGDGRRVRNIFGAIWDGYEAARSL